MSPRTLGGVLTSRRLLAVLLTSLLVMAACGTDEGGDNPLGDSSQGNLDADPGDCIVVDMAVSSEKIELLTDLAGEFNNTGAEVNGECVFVRVQKKASGGAEQLLEKGWDESIEGPRPVVWSPASSAWAAVLNQRLSEQGEPSMANEVTPFMLTPVVIAMPEPMAEALGYPDTPIGFTDILELARSEQGWAEFGHPEWGQFRLGKTNPNFSTTGLNTLFAQTYAATGKTTGLSLEDLARPEVVDFGTGVESAVVHYGDTTLTFLNNWYEADQRGNPFAYVSAVAIEEKSMIDYNTGNPDGIVDQGEEPRPPRIPLVAIYPKEGTLFSDNPFIILDAEWVNEDQKAGARLFQDFVQQPENQERVLEFGFRPGNSEVAVGAPIVAANGVDPAQPATLLDVPSPEVAVEILDLWEDQRKTARVDLVIDVSGSMGDAAVPGGSETKLDLAKRAAIEALDQFGENDEVGLRVFTTDLDAEGAEFIDLVQVERVGDVREALKREIGQLVPLNGTPLYSVTQASFDDALATFDPTRINAVVLLTDGKNEDGDSSDDRRQLDELLTSLRANSESETGSPVRVFAIGYGAGADFAVLGDIASASNGAVYDASDPASISKVFAEVISNF